MSVSSVPGPCSLETFKMKVTDLHDGKPTHWGWLEVHVCLGIMGFLSSISAETDKVLSEPGHQARPTSLFQGSHSPVGPYLPLVLAFYRQILNGHKFLKIMKAMFCLGILLYIYCTGYFTADTRLPHFRWQNAKQWAWRCPASCFLASTLESLSVCKVETILSPPSFFSEVTPLW